MNEIDLMKVKAEELLTNISQFEKYDDTGKLCLRNVQLKNIRKRICDLNDLMYMMERNNVA